MTEEPALTGAAMTPTDRERFRRLMESADEHRQRIAFLEKLRAGLESTIERHRSAIALIEAHGVTCLAEIPEATA